MSALIFDRLSKTFDTGVEALDGLSANIAAGAFVSLIGPSGCGKSTALRIAAGLESPSAGAALWPDGKPETGFVFQEPALMPWASVGANVALPLKLKRLPRSEIDARSAEALERVGLATFTKALPRTLSGGMKMRVSIARALAARPQALLMDEPFAALDEFTRHRLNDELLGLWRASGFTVLFVTHSVFESVYLSQRVLVLSGRPGRLAADIAIPEPYPRDEAFRTSAAYGGYCRAVLDALRKASVV